VGQRAGCHLAPRRAPVVAENLKHASLACSAERLQLPVSVNQNRRLDGAKLNAIVDRSGLRPGRAKVARALEMYLPLAWPRGRFGAGRTEQDAAGQFDGFVLDRSQDAIRQAARFRPTLSAVSRRRQHPPPGARRRTDLIEEEKVSLRRLKQNRVPGWVP